MTLGKIAGQALPGLTIAGYILFTLTTGITHADNQSTLEGCLKPQREIAETVERSANLDLSTPTATVVTRISTTTPTQCLVSVLAFHDFNGNGNHDRREPPVQEIRISAAGLSGVTGRDGRCELGYLPYLPEGQYSLVVQDPSAKLRYILPSIWEVRPIEDGLQFCVKGNTVVLIPLGVGFLSSPFDTRTIYSYVDLDKRLKKIIDWRGRKKTVDTHSGIDGKTRRAYAAAPGWIISAEDNWKSDPKLRYPGNRVIILHLSGLTTAYNHLGTLNSDIKRINIEEGRQLWFNQEFDKLQYVPRGQKLGSIGLTGNTTGLHLHFEVNRKPWQRRGMLYTSRRGGWASRQVIDPYKWIGHDPLPSSYANPVSLWIVENKPR